MGAGRRPALSAAPVQLAGKALSARELPNALAGSVAAVLVAGTAVLAPSQPLVALAIAGATLLGAVLLQGTPWLIAVAVPGVWLGEIVRLAGGAISIADALLVVGLLAAVLRINWQHPAVRTELLLVVAVQAVSVLALVHAPTTFGAQEWGHRLLLVGGGVVIGAGLVRAGMAALALRMFIWGGAAVGLLSCAIAVATHFAPAYPLLNKNYAGDLLASAMLLALLVPIQWTHLRTSKWPVIAAMALGLAATQSRGAVIGLAAGLVVYYLCSRRFDARSMIVLLITVVGTAFIANSFVDQSSVEQVQGYGSIFLRQQNIQYALQAWQQSPLLGVGIRFWQSGLYSLSGDPHNVLVYVLAESGIVGLAAFALLLAGTARITLGSRSGLAAVAIALLAARFVHGLFDVYWVHGSLAIPWILVGIAVALAPEHPTVARAVSAR